ncbi:MAG: hypothetical protein JXR95_05335 [Deltaproteobacteria bacterium]|nr:hypothetical protein [Deltaproteobacteria bacterium]
METIDISGQILELEEDYHKKPWDKKLILLLIDVYQENNMWDKLIDMLKRLAELETDGNLKAGYFNTIGQIFQFETGSELDAVDYYNRALDENIHISGSYHNLVNLLTSRENWFLLERNIKRMITRIEKKDPGNHAVLFNLYYDLGDILYKNRNEIVQAVGAYKKSLEYSPGDSHVKKDLSVIFEQHNETFLDDAISLCEEISINTPRDPDNLARLFRLYQKAARYDESWCVASLLNSLGNTDKFTRDYFERYNTSSSIPWKNFSGNGEFEKFIWKNPGDEFIEPLFIILATVMAERFSKPWKKSGLRKENAEVFTPDSPMFTSIFNKISEILLKMPVKLFLVPELEGGITRGIVRDDDNSIIPVVSVGGDMLSGLSEKELVYHISRELFYYHPPRFLMKIMGSLSELYGLLLGSIRFADKNCVLDGDEEVIQTMASMIESFISPETASILESVVKKMISETGIPSFQNYLYRIEASSIRVTHALINDPAVSLKLLDDSQLIAKNQAENILISFLISEKYFQFRKNSGISIV